MTQDGPTADPPPSDDTTPQVSGLSSMATKSVLADLCRALTRQGSIAAAFTSVGGVEVARRLRAGGRADIVVLDEQTMAELNAHGMFEPATVTPLFVSDVVAAVPDGAEIARFTTEADLRAALASAARIAYSTGPSGAGLLELIERWELLDLVEPKLLRTEPGTPVAALLAGGDADLGFQQRSELLNVAGVHVLGALPGNAALRSTFNGAVLARSTNKTPARHVLDFLASRDADEVVAAAGMSRPRLHSDWQCSNV